MANILKTWRGAVEPASVSVGNNEYKAWRGAVEPSIPIGTGSVTGSSVPYPAGLYAEKNNLISPFISGM